MNCVVRDICTEVRIDLFRLTTKEDREEVFSREIRRYICGIWSHLLCGHPASFFTSDSNVTLCLRSPSTSIWSSQCNSQFSMLVFKENILRHFYSNTSDTTLHIYSRNLIFAICFSQIHMRLHYISILIKFSHMRYKWHEIYSSFLLVFSSNRTVISKMK